MQTPPVFLTEKLKMQLLALLPTGFRVQGSWFRVQGLGFIVALLQTNVGVALH